MRVLFIGGTGKISSACAQLAVERGIELYLLNRRQTTMRPAPATARILAGDCRGDQVIEMARLLEAGRIGVRLAVDHVRRNGMDDLQQTAVLASVEIDREARIRVLRSLPQVVGNRQFMQAYQV